MDAVIIGAGAAGLAAAAELTRAGRRVVLLEARDRIGGRILTHREPGLPAPIELGAEFVHGRPPELARHGLTLCDVTGDHLCSRLGAINPCDEDELNPLLDAMEGAPEQPFSTFVTARPEPQHVKRWATNYVEGFNAAVAARVSVRALAEENRAQGELGSDHLYRVLGGYDRVIDLLWRAIDPALCSLHLRAPVRRIRWRPGEVELDSGLRASAAIVTVPLAVLQSGAIRFEPEPPHLQPALDALEMGNVLRLTLRFREAFWEDAWPQLGFIHADDPEIPTCWTPLPIRARYLTCWAGGPAADRFRDEPVEKCVAALSRLLGRDAAPHLLAAHLHDWRNDPFSRGAYSFVKVGGWDAAVRFGEPVERTLCFAGEAVETRHRATVHGAIATGIRAARAFL